jgi:mono/diheme cytochrome c family protein
MSMSVALIASLAVLSPCHGADAARGQQLFETHCIACHSSGLFQREHPKVRDWNQLLQEVRSRQAQAGQRWSPADISDVASYLNDRFYHFPHPASASRPDGSRPLVATKASDTHSQR